jgi:ATP-dependent helicase/nuclease subunit A
MRRTRLPVVDVLGHGRLLEPCPAQPAGGLPVLALDAVLASAVLGQINAFTAWVRARWPIHSTRAEAFVSHGLGTGQRVAGRIDLLLDTPQGLILIDHKSSPLGADRWNDLAAIYGGQLDAYAQAIEACDGRRVVEQWLFLPVAGGAVRCQ